MDMEEAMIARFKEIVKDLSLVERLLVWEEYVREVVVLVEVILLLSIDTKEENT
jgi:hypothetical protein